MFNHWLQLVKRIVETLPRVVNLTCPECNKNEIDFQYVGDLKTKVGYLDIWCNSCSKGIHISRTKIPENAPMLSFEDSPELIGGRIPNFKQITPLDN